MEFSDLKSALWEAANTLRGSAVDRTDWKGYILPLLFFKRISDCWDEETAEAAEEAADAAEESAETVEAAEPAAAAEESAEAAEADTEEKKDAE